MALLGSRQFSTPDFCCALKDSFRLHLALTQVYIFMFLAFCFFFSPFIVESVDNSGKRKRARVKLPIYMRQTNHDQSCVSVLATGLLGHSSGVLARSSPASAVWSTVSRATQGQLDGNLLWTTWKTVRYVGVSYEFSVETMNSRLLSQPLSQILLETGVSNIPAQDWGRWLNGNSGLR